MEDIKIEGAVILQKRKFWKKVLLFPKLFKDLLKIGKPGIKFIYRLLAAWHFAIFSLKNNLN